MKKLFKVAAIILVMAMLFSGCAKEKNNGDKTTISIQIYERGDVPNGAGTITDNEMTRWVQKTFGDPNNIEVKYSAIPRSEDVSQLNILMAANEAPDLIFSYSLNTLTKYYNEGGIIDLTEYLEKSPKLKAFLGDEVLEYGKVDGKQVMIPAKRLIQGRMAQHIRQDWLDAVGMEAPTNKTELYQVLKAFIITNYVLKIILQELKQRL